MTVAAWDGEQGEFWIANAGRHEVMLSKLTLRLYDAADFSAGERVLDVGCGYGETALRAARAVMPGSVLGIDLSGLQLDVARRAATSSGLRNLSFVRGDAQTSSFAEGSFDLAISRLGVMFFADPVAAFTNIAYATRSGGRLAFLCWQVMECNTRAALPLRVIAAYAPSLSPTGGDGPGPYSMADPSRIRALLTTAGYAHVRIEPVEESLRLGDDADDVVRYYQKQPSTKSCIAAVGPPLVDRVLTEIRSELLAHETPDGVFVPSAAWLVTARRR